MKIIPSRFSTSYIKVVFFIALYFALAMNLPIYADIKEILQKLEQVNIGFIISIPFFFFAVFNFLFHLFAWPKIVKPFFIILLLLSAAVNYAQYNYGVILDSEMIRNVMETDQNEASSYLSLYSTLWVLLFGGLPALLLAVIPIRQESSLIKLIFKKLLSMLSSLLVIAIIAALFYQHYASVGRNNAYLRQLIIPTYFIYSTAKYINHSYFYEPIAYKKIGEDAKQSEQSLEDAKQKPSLMIFVLGETARSHNYELNGYRRATNYYTKPHQIISFQDMTSCGTATAISVPCMFSMLNRENYDRNIANSQDNVIDILKRAKIDILWLENNSGDKDVARNVKKITINPKQKSALCNGRTCFDMALLNNFEQQIDSMTGNRVVFLHLMGSHGPTYYQRYPKDMKKFHPDCQRADIENCSVGQIVNTYDNTILYTDLVIGETIKKLKNLESKYRTALLYMSDHGESLGENGLFLHGMPYAMSPEYQTKIPMMFWMSDEFEQHKNLSSACLKEAAKQNAYSHDFVFHSLLGIMDVQTKVYDSNMDIFSPCR